MVSCTASFQETSANIGEVIHADFTWDDALFHVYDHVFATMAILDPTGTPRDIYIEIFLNSGSKQLSFTTDMAGTWTARIDVANISTYFTCTDTVLVSHNIPFGSASFQESSATVGDTIHADFTWDNALFHATDHLFATMAILDPNDTPRAIYIETNNNSGSKQLSFTTDMVGTWTAIIDVSNLVNYITYTDTVAVSSGPNDPIVYEMVTYDLTDYEHCWGYTSSSPCNNDPDCRWYSWGCGPTTAYNWHPPVKTTYQYGERVGLYVRFDCPVDTCGGFRNKTRKYELWDLDTNTLKGENSWTCGPGTTCYDDNWWSFSSNWWWTGLSGAPSGTNYRFKAFVDGILLDSTDFVMIGSGLDVIGSIVFDSSTFYEGPFTPGTYQLIATVWCENIGTETGTIYIKKFIDGVEVDSYMFENRPPGVPWNCCNFYWDLPSDDITAGIKVWGEGEDEPPWGTLGTKIFKIR